MPLEPGPDVPSNLPGWLYAAGGALVAAIGALFRLLQLSDARRVTEAEARVAALEAKCEELRRKHEEERETTHAALRQALAEALKTQDELRRLAGKPARKRDE